MLGVQGAANDFAVGHSLNKTEDVYTFTSGKKAAKEMRAYTVRSRPSPIDSIPRSLLVTSTLAQQFLSQKSKEVVTIQLPLHKGELYFGHAVMAINEQLELLSPKKHIINISGTSSQIDGLYNLVKTRGFNTVKLVPIKEFSMQREYNANIDHILVLNDFLQVEKVHTEVVEQILSKLGNWDRSMDVTIQTESSPGKYSFRPISSENMNQQLKSLGRALKRVVITPEFLSNYPGPVVMGLAPVFESHRRAESVISIEISWPEGEKNFRLNQQQKENYHMAYRLAKGMGYQTARVGVANDVVFKIPLPQTDHLFMLKNPQDRLTSIFSQRVKKFSLKETLESLGRVITISETSMEETGKASSRNPSHISCDKMLNSVRSQ